MSEADDSGALSLREKLSALYAVATYRPWLAAGIVALSVFAATLEGLGLSFLIPVIEIAQGRAATGETSGIGSAFVSVYETLGLPFTLETVIAGVGVVMVTRYLSSFLVAWLRALIRTDYIRYLKSEGLASALDARVGYYDDHGSDEVLNAIVTQTEYAGRTIPQVVKIIQQGALSLVYLSIAVYLAPVLSLATGVVLGGFLLVLRRVLEGGYAVGGRVAEANERIQTAVQAATQGIREVKLYGLGGELYDRFREAVDVYTRSTVRLRRNQAAISNFYQMVTAITVFVLIYLALTAASLSLASLGVFLFAMFRLAPRMSTLNNYLYKLDGNLPHLVRTQRFVASLRRQEEPDDGTTPPPDPVESVAFEDVTFAYDGEPVLSGVSFAVDRDEFVAFVGQSGAGKSTVVSLLARLYEPDSGAITADGTPVDRFPLEAWRDRVAVVRQNPYVFDETLRYNVTVGNRDADEAEIRAACEVAQVTEFLDDLAEGLDTELGDEGVRLSGGQRQRVAIARALLKPADVLVLDEATSDLDSRLEAAVHEGIEGATDRATIVIAHRLSTVTDADRIYAMADGRVVERGSHDDLLAAGGTYADLYATQS